MDKPNPVKKDPLILVGEKLKLARENRSLDIEQVRKQTHIHSRVLIALEEGRCDEILTPIYVKAFLKKYVQFLGLDPKDIIKDYSSAHPEESFAQPRTGIDAAPGPTSQNFARIVLLILAALSVLFILAWSIGIVKKSVMAKKGASQKPAAIKNANKHERAVKAPAVKKGPFTLALKIKKPVFIKAKKDGALLFSRVFSKGLSDSIKAGEKVELYIADAGSVDLILDGKQISPPGRGIIENLEVTSEGAKVK